MSKKVLKRELKIESVEEAMSSIILGARYMGWNISIPQLPDDVNIPGMILGEDAYVDSVTGCLDEKGFKYKS